MDISQSQARKNPLPPSTFRGLFLTGIVVSVLAVTLAGCGSQGTHFVDMDKRNDHISTLSVRTPAVSGPLTNEPSSSDTRNYQFFASDIALRSKGYIEEEFFMIGKANAYDIPFQDFGPTVLPRDFTSSVVAAELPYKTRIIVRRPIVPAHFNGTVVIEWLNVTDGFDGEYFWVQAKDYLLRSGYAYVGVSAQDHAISISPLALKKFSPARYGTLDITGSGTFPSKPDQSGDDLSYDVFSQAAKAARAIPQVLNGLSVRNIIGIGMSQAGQRVAGYANYMHDKTKVFDAFLIQVANQSIRHDLAAPLIKVLSETETKTISGDQADTEKRHTWWVAGTNHGDATQRLGRTAVRLRDLGLKNTGNDNCVVNKEVTPTRTRTPFRHVVNAAIHHLKKQVETGAIPPSGNRFITETNGSAVSVARDNFGNVVGGIRLAHLEVPTATANGIICGNVGAWIPFTDSTLKALYPSHSDYVDKVTRAVKKSITSGFVLEEDGRETIEEAQASIFGYGLQCGILCLSSGHFRTDFSSTGLLRDHTVYYNTTNGKSILDAINQAHRLVATGYTHPISSLERKLNFNSATIELRRYVDLIKQAKNEGRVTSTAAETLIEQANNIAEALSREF